MLENRIPQRMAGTAERICAKFTRKTCLVPRSKEFECQGQSHQEQKKRCALRTPRDESIAGEGCLRRPAYSACGVPRAVGLAGYRWLCHAFLVLFQMWFHIKINTETF